MKVWHLYSLLLVQYQSQNWMRLFLSRLSVIFQCKALRLNKQRKHLMLQETVLSFLQRFYPLHPNKMLYRYFLILFCWLSFWKGFFFFFGVMIVDSVTLNMLSNSYKIWSWLLCHINLAYYHWSHGSRMAYCISSEAVCSSCSLIVCGDICKIPYKWILGLTGIFYPKKFWLQWNFYSLTECCVLYLSNRTDLE